MPKSLRTVAILLAASLADAAENPPEFSGPEIAGDLVEPTNLEASGLAASRRTPGLLWTHNDSGGAPVLFALGADGSRRGSVELAGVVNRDWEDVSAFTLDGQAWLMAAETGDNFARFPRVALYFVPEPAATQLDPARPLVVAPTLAIHFVYEDGPRDCEAVAVDPAERAIYLLTKRDTPNRLYRLPLTAAPADRPAMAHCIGTLWRFPPPSVLQRLSPVLAVAYPGWPTAMKFLPDGSGALVLTYGGLHLFPRQPGESWAAALARAPVTLPPFSLPQAEALEITPDGESIYVASERTTQFLRYTRRR